MKIYRKIWLMLFSFVAGLPLLAQEQRFPKPEFESGYQQPTPTAHGARSLLLEYLDVFVLVAALSLVTWFVLKKEIAKVYFGHQFFSLLYFGFFREGCICSVGAIQNVVLAIVDPTYILPLTALLFFIIPLVFALFFGRVFCAAVCPLGAIQDLVAIKPIEIPRWLQKVLGLLPYLYLALAVLYAATKSDFIICRYDPFVGIFRLGGTFQMLLLGGLFLLVGIFIARPYCRFLCPYGVILGWMSTFSKKHMTITPSKCIQCKLCANACPYGAIEEPVETEKNRRKNVKKFTTYIILIPLWMAIGGLSFSMLHAPLSRLNKTVYLAERIVENPDLVNNQDDIDIRTFMQQGKSLDELVLEAKEIQSQFYWGGWIIGLFMGLVVGVMLVHLTGFRSRDDYEPDKTNCLSCARCMDFCPVTDEKK